MESNTNELRVDTSIEAQLQRKRTHKLLGIIMLFAVPAIVLPIMFGVSLVSIFIVILLFITYAIFYNNARKRGFKMSIRDAFYGGGFAVIIGLSALTALAILSSITSGDIKYSPNMQILMIWTLVCAAVLFGGVFVISCQAAFVFWLMSLLGNNKQNKTRLDNNESIDSAVSNPVNTSRPPAPTSQILKG